ncbi:uncharacterized protein LOC118225889 [Anguilla anguilla]|uniref:uncharacterized protein LOC118225889 n=1 Tax=Anguilla anguilla TaxID=7936 RepID=UPI0015B2DD3D|nr:uncharacterized protein LOC118225889 [Anguilla anguilla]XP_035270855.1 uncharacterized protein LOC118225889 [Anguilla anguilla]XP_035270856.1 uncharacterized protein LOC118225889 [Anguilla anguilla]XP_035270857.1 uncharacterized protein LOC118225889 [Anguilla anguilla]XP_035270858.1 uncharacterized protein LOC118225889 [Anguilla anguilla]
MMDYTKVEQRSLRREEERVESITGYGLTREERDILSNIKEEKEEENEDCLSRIESEVIKSEDGVKDEEVIQLSVKEEKESDEESEIDETTQTEIRMKNNLFSTSGESSTEPFVRTHWNQNEESHPTLENLADKIIPPGHGDAGPSVVDCHCCCKLNEGKPCHTRFPKEELLDVRLQYLNLSREELDIAILSKLSCGMHLSDTTSRSRKREQTQRLAHRTDYYYHGHRICRDVFKYLHGVGQDKLNALMKHYKAAGVEARVHKLNKRLPANALKLQDTSHCGFHPQLCRGECDHSSRPHTKHWNVKKKM